MHFKGSNKIVSITIAVYYEYFSINRLKCITKTCYCCSNYDLYNSYVDEFEWR